LGVDRDLVVRKSKHAKSSSFNESLTSGILKTLETVNVSIDFDDKPTRPAARVHKKLAYRKLTTKFVTLQLTSSKSIPKDVLSRRRFLTVISSFSLQPHPQLTGRSIKTLFSLHFSFEA
jgi:hypothetical protein